MSNRFSKQADMSSVIKPQFKKLMESLKPGLTLSHSGGGGAIVPRAATSAGGSGARATATAPAGTGGGGGGKGPPTGGRGPGPSVGGAADPKGFPWWKLLLLGGAAGTLAATRGKGDKGATPVVAPEAPAPSGAIDLSNIARNALIGTGIGVGGGAITGLMSNDKKKNKLRSLLENALIGGAGGAALGGLSTPVINSIK